jgi:hypothetical protein
MAVSDSTHRMATADVMDRIKAIAGTEADAPVTEPLHRCSGLPQRFGVRALHGRP